MSFVVTQEVQDFVKDLVQFGVKGMKWGVRKDDSGGSSGGSRKEAKAAAKAAKATAKGDKQWEKKSGTTSAYFKVYNSAANRMNHGEIDRINNIPKYKKAADAGILSDMSHPTTKAYFKEYSDTFTRMLNEESDRLLGTNPSGTRRVNFTFDAEKDFLPPAQFDDVKHDAMGHGISVKLEKDANGLITSFSVETTAVQHSLDDHLEHFGVKGMKWGVRKDDSSSSSSQSSDAAAASAAQAKISKGGGTSSLNNSELQALVNRMNLEQQYSNLSSKSQTKSLGLRILQGSAKGTGKFAGQIAREQAKNAANLVLKQAIKKALKQKGLID